MKRITRLCFQLAAFWTGILSLSGCLRMPTLQPTRGIVTATAPGPIPTSGPVYTVTPPPQPSPLPNSVALGPPAWIGRGQMVDAVFLPGAKQVAIAWGSGVSLDSVDTGQEAWFQPTPTNVLAFDLQPQAKLLAAALADGSVVLFDIVDGHPREFKGAQPNAIQGDLAWSPDGVTVAFQFIAPPVRGDPIYLLDTTSGAITQLPNSAIDPSVDPVLVWSPDGSTLTVASLGNECPRLVDSHTGQDRMALGGPGECYSDQALAWLPDGKLLAVPDPNGGAALLRFPEGNPARYLYSSAQVGSFPGIKRSLFIDPGGKWLASRGGVGLNGHDFGQPFIVWDIASGGVKAQISTVLKPLEGRRRMAAVFDGSSILILYESGEITRWVFTDSAAQEKMLVRIPSIPPAQWTVRWSLDGSHLAFSGRYGGVDVWEAASAQVVRHFDAPLDTPALSPDGSKVALFNPDKNVETIFDLASGSPVRVLDASRVSSGPVFSPAGRYLAYGAGAQARLADMESVQVMSLVPSPADKVSSPMSVTRLIWSPNGQAIVTVFGIPDSDAIGVVILWLRNKNNTFEEVYHVANVQASNPDSRMNLAIFNPSGGRVALQGKDEVGTAQGQLMVVYDLQAGKVILTLDQTTADGWMNDDELLVSPQGRLERINVVTGANLSGFGIENENAYAPNGNYYMHEALTNPRGILILQWQESDNTKIAARGILESNGLVDYGWSPDGRWAFALGADGTLRLWPVVFN